MRLPWTVEVGTSSNESVTYATVPSGTMTESAVYCWLYEEVLRYMRRVERLGISSAS